MWLAEPRADELGERSLTARERHGGSVELLDCEARRRKLHASPPADKCKVVTVN